MSGSGTIRQLHPKSKELHCVVCGSTDDVERHHVGGRNHVAWFTVPLCRQHHVRLTIAIRHAGVDMRHTTDIRERFARARMANQLFLWTLEEALKDYEQKEKQQ
jgi:hypothetical protein